MIARVGKAEENKKKKREALLRTAFDLFTSQGFSKTTVANIAENAGVAKGTFYLYFKDKYDLRDKLVRHEASEILKRAFDALQATGLRTFEEKMLFMTGNVISQLTENKLVLKFISRNLSWGMLKHDVSDLTPFDGEDLDVEQIYIQELKKSDVKAGHHEEPGGSGKFCGRIIKIQERHSARRAVPFSLPILCSVLFRGFPSGLSGRYVRIRLSISIYLGRRIILERSGRC